MFELTKDRDFQPWEYRISHGSLLIRSPARKDSPDRSGFNRNVNIICSAVEYIAAPRYLGEITIGERSQFERDDIERMLGKALHKQARAWALQGSHHRSLVAAVFLRVEENDGDIFDSPFSFAYINRPGRENPGHSEQCFSAGGLEGGQALATKTQSRMFQV